MTTSSSLFGVHTLTDAEVNTMRATYNTQAQAKRKLDDAMHALDQGHYTTLEEVRGTLLPLYHAFMDLSFPSVEDAQD